MTTYTCELCQFTTRLKSNHTNHLLTKKHIRNSEIVSQQLAQINPIVHPCKYCLQSFKHKSSLSKHIKYSCTKNKTEDLIELVQQMNLQRELQMKEYQNIVNTQNKQIEKLMEKLETQNSFNADVSPLTNEDYRRCIKEVCSCITSTV